MTVHVRKKIPMPIILVFRANCRIDNDKRKNAINGGRYSTNKKYQSERSKKDYIRSRYNRQDRCLFSFTYHSHIISFTYHIYISFTYHYYVFYPIWTQTTGCSLWTSPDQSFQRSESLGSPTQQTSDSHRFTKPPLRQYKPSSSTCRAL